MVIDKICKMSMKGVKLKSESFFSISPGVLELWRKNLRGADSAPPPVQIGLMLIFLFLWIARTCKGVTANKLLCNSQISDLKSNLSHTGQIFLRSPLGIK